jgi:hypothetical protein
VCPEPLGMDAGNLVHTGVRSRDGPARSVDAKPITLRTVTKLIAVYFQYPTKTIKTPPWATFPVNVCYIIWYIDLI